jgi:hypothetical protein
MTIMTWNLFLDDERNLEDVTWAPWEVREKYRNEVWIICRNWSQVASMIRYLESYPSYISFDHDLGDNEATGYDIVKMMIEDSMNHPDDPMLQFSDTFAFYVHSQNPVGKANIEAYLNNYLKHKG